MSRRDYRRLPRGAFRQLPHRLNYEGFLAFRAFNPPSSQFVFCLKTSTAFSTSYFNRHFSPSIELSQFRPRAGLPPTTSILWCERVLATAPPIMRCQKPTFSKIQFSRREIARTGRCQPQIKTFPTPQPYKTTQNIGVNRIRPAAILPADPLFPPSIAR